MPLTSSMEDYLEAVLVIQQQKGYARCVDVAEHLGVTKPSVSRAVRELWKEGYLIRKDDGTLFLPSHGQYVAEKIRERHCFFTEQLIEAGVDPKTAETDACRMEHGISDESFAKLKVKYQKEI